MIVSISTQTVAHSEGLRMLLLSFPHNQRATPQADRVMEVNYPNLAASNELRPRILDSGPLGFFLWTLKKSTFGFLV